MENKEQNNRSCKIALKGDKVEQQIVYHEFGHVFGFYISQKLNYYIGEIKKIELENNRGSVLLRHCPYTYVPTNLSREEEIEARKQIKQNMEKDKRQLLVYFLYSLSGAVFNVLYFERKPIFENFIKIFCNDEKLEQIGSYQARAGNDFQKLLYGFKCGSLEEYDFNNKFKKMSYELFYILDKHSIFDYLIGENSVLEIFEQTFNGFLTDDVSKINELLELIKKAIPDKNLDNLLIEINELLDKYISDIDSTLENKKVI